MPWPEGADSVQYSIRISEGTNETSFGITVPRNNTINSDVVHDLLEDALRKFRSDLAALYPDDHVASNRLYIGSLPSHPWPAP